MGNAEDARRVRDELRGAACRPWRLAVNCAHMFGVYDRFAFFFDFPAAGGTGRERAS